MSSGIPSARGWAKMILFGAIAGTILDGFHTHSGTTSYPAPIFWLAAWWVPFLFAFAYSAGGAAYAFFRARLGGRSISLGVRVVAAAVFCGLYFASGYLPASNAVKLGVLLVGALGLWLATDRALASVLAGIGAALLGPLTEIVLVHFGAFAHLQPDVLGIPIWLPALYLASAPGIGPLMAWLGEADDSYGASQTKMPRPPVPAK